MLAVKEGEPRNQEDVNWTKLEKKIQIKIVGTLQD